MSWKLSEIVEKRLKAFLSLKADDWVEWIAQQNDWKDDCDKFDGCYFIVKQMPKYPQHQNCQCQLEKIAKPIPYIIANATCNINKFTGYLFSDKYDDGKKELFEYWGYTIEESKYLQQLYISQAIQKYCDGEYQYVGVNDYNAKISITITLTNQVRVQQHINTIWKLGQKGNIVLVTPYSGHSY